MAQILFTARHGGSSVNQYESLNIGNHVGDDSAAVEDNRKILKELVSQVSPIFMNQVHGNEVVEVDISSHSPITADALITRQKGLPLIVLSADCLPILIKGENVVGAIHVGRKGVLNGIISKTVTSMREIENLDFTAIIGPAICANCYEVDSAMYAEAISVEPQLSTNLEVHCLDLKRAASSQLTNLGVQVEVLDICTAHNLNFFSYRRDGVTGRSAGVIVL